MQPTEVIEFISATPVEGAQAELDAAWQELQSVPSYVERNAEEFAAEA
jgi:hypothetical protein